MVLRFVITGCQSSTVVKKSPDCINNSRNLRAAQESGEKKMFAQTICETVGPSSVSHGSTAADATSDFILFVGLNVSIRITACGNHFASPSLFSVDQMLFSAMVFKIRMFLRRFINIRDFHEILSQNVHRFRLDHP